MNGLMTVGYYLFGLVFSLLTFILWIRIGLRFFRVSVLNPVSQLISTLTDPVLHSIDAFILKKQGRRSRYDWAAFFALLIVELFQFTMLGLFFFKVTASFLDILILVLADLIIVPCNILFFAILIRVIIDWARPDWQHPVVDLLRLFTEPLLVFGRKIIPDISGFDFSPLIILIFLKVTLLFVAASIPVQSF